MKVSYNWIRQFITVPESIEEHAALLTSLGLEVEGIEKFESVKGGLQGIVVGHVLECVKHPNADKLKLTKVNIGTETVQIVCGAPNVAAGQKVPVATIGTTLYTETGEAWKIKKGKIRGEESHGMICAEDELNIGTSHDGIMVLDASLEPGTLFSEVINIENDYTIEIGLTPNRSDAMSHLGVARDLRAGLAIEGDLLEFITPSVSSFHVDNRSHRVDIAIDQPELAPRYCGVTLTGLTIKDSPDWIQNRLKAIGIAPKNNVVDITNYVMHELGQPLHAFDLSAIEGNKIVVKTLPAGTKFTTLDEVEHDLHEEDLMICDGVKPLCIAGVYGGLNSGVKKGTNSIFLESAYFNPVSVRKTAKRHGFNTDASFRFERGIDPNITEYALKRAALLIIETAGGEISSDITDVYSHKIEDQQVFLPFSKVNSLIGKEIPKEEIKSILRTLDIHVNNVTETGLGLTIPAYRNDVTRPADVIEEILRVYGYDRIETSDKLNASIAKSSRLDNHKLQNLVAQQLAGQGFYEMMANSLTSDKYHTLTEQISPKNEVRMLNPLSSDLSVMRQSMIYGALEAVSHNINRRQENLRLFEFGNTYHQYQERQFTEQKHLSLITTGAIHEQSWNNTSRTADFFYLKGAVISALKRLGITKINEKPTKMDFLSEGISLNSGTKIADLGVVKKKVCKSFDIDATVHYANIYWDEVLKLVKEDRKSVTAIPKFPAVKRDLALLVNDETSFKELHDIALQTEKKLLKEVQLFDVYEGKNLAKGKKSYALSFLLQDEVKTLTDKQIDKAMQKIQQQLEKQAGVELR
ncbi:phenylalanine--tRNA ligase subunit beta [Nonlabens ulvanivorans]|uniref:Phenylalanine--tRNA ligase beta subunit n=1 Tax=Nonlabens ulvanivorans TaxID=906888 RepID=A0A084JXE8_NONUL|nr:phenylalanine--tRNA ligase subunit beta [Nonlabens ulvanivorans]KEZ93632.1 phenylalanyl-tRNA synthetase subunit beta [Nonlabens ulvanivorans]PRX14219.1 phenylalanyl-tRNA synthetase beta subunit [Nonlabens ulvanivorans]